MLLFTVECLLDRCGNDIDGYLVVSALRDNDVCIPFGRFDELQVHGFHGLAVVGNGCVDVAAALGDIPQDDAHHAIVIIGSLCRHLDDT